MNSRTAKLMSLLHTLYLSWGVEVSIELGNITNSSTINYTPYYSVYDNGVQSFSFDYGLYAQDSCKCAELHTFEGSPNSSYHIPVLIRNLGVESLSIDNAQVSNLENFEYVEGSISKALVDR